MYEILLIFLMIIFICILCCLFSDCCSMYDPSTIIRIHDRTLSNNHESREIDNNENV